MQRLSLLIAALLLSVSTGLVKAQEAGVPSLVSYQGKLVKADGSNYSDGNHQVTFRLYDAATSGTLVWGATYTVTVVNGVFSVALGALGGQPLNPPAPVTDLRFAFNGATRFLEIMVAGVPLQPRQQITGTPYAFQANQANTISGGGNRVSLGNAESGFLELRGGSAPYIDFTSGNNDYDARFQLNNPDILSLYGARLYAHEGINIPNGGVIDNSGEVLSLHAAGAAIALRADTTIKGRCDARAFIVPNGGYIDNSGDVLSLYGNGNVIAARGSFTVKGRCDAYAFDIGSDARLKTDIQPIHAPDQILHSLNGVSYQFNQGVPDKEHLPEGLNFGVIAQDVQKVMPHAVREGKDGYLSVDYNQIVPVLIESLKQQQAENAALRKQMKQVEARLNKLENR